MLQENQNANVLQGDNIAQTENVDNKVQTSNLISKVWDGIQYVETKGLSYEELMQRENSLKENYKREYTDVKTKLALYRKSLESTLSDIEKMYKGYMNVFDGICSLDVKSNIDTLVRLSGVSIDDLFDAKFVGSLFDTYTYQLKYGVQTLKSKKCRVTDKTDFIKESDKVLKQLSLDIDLSETQFTEGKVVYYWKPILNFTVKTIFDTVFSINKDSLFRISLQVLKAEKKAAKRKEKKAAKKAANTNTDNTETK